MQGFTGYPNLAVPNSLTGSGAPQIVPQFIGQQYIDIVSGAIYRAAGISSITDWQLQSFPISFMRRKGGISRGSSNTNVIIYSTAVEASGSDITYINSATAGDSFLINTNGVYTITACSVNSTLTSYIQIRQSATLNNNVSDADTRSTTTLTAGYGGTTTYTGHISAGQKIWIVTGQAMDSTYPDLCAISIARVY